MTGEEHTPAEVGTLGRTEAVGDFRLSRRELLGLRLAAFEDCTDAHLLRYSKPLSKTIAGVMLTGVLALPVADKEGATLSCQETDIACALAAEGFSVPADMRLGPIETPATTVITVTESTTTIGTIPPAPDTTALTTLSTELPPETTPVVAEASPLIYNPEVAAASPEAIASLEAMNLTVEGYQAFFSNIDLSWFDYAQDYINFNPAFVSDPQYAGEHAIHQGVTQWITPHFTASYTNSPEAGTSEVPVGEMRVDRLIDFLGTARGVPCCGVNFIIDRHGRVIQTAPYQAKLRHNPPYDGLTTGFEIEAMYERQLTTAQFESATYLTIAMLVNDGLMGTKPLVDGFRGHGETRDIHRSETGDRKWDIRNDFDKPIMDVWRAKIAEFLQLNPNVFEFTQPLR